ncbi:hypothetical protein RFI_40135, partial [Reticulomyxa filosa]
CAKRSKNDENQLCEGSFFEHYKHTIDKLVTMGLINILLACYENCYFQVCFNGFEQQMTELDHIFVSCAKSFSLLQIEEIKQVTSRLAEDTIELHVVPMKYIARFPFSRLLHHWCQKQLVDEIVNNPKVMALDETIKIENVKTEEIKTDEIKAEEMKIEETKVEDQKTSEQHQFITTQSGKRIKIVQSGKLLATLLAEFSSLNDCSEDTCQKYVMDVIVEIFSVASNLVPSLKNIILCIACTVCGSISLANCETVLYFYGDGTDTKQLEMSVEQMLPSFDLLVQITNNLCQHFFNINIGINFLKQFFGITFS